VESAQTEPKGSSKAPVNWVESRQQACKAEHAVGLVFDLNDHIYDPSSMISDLCALGERLTLAKEEGSDSVVEHCYASM